MDNNISRSAVENIKKQHIKPIPKLEFTFKKAAIWSAAFISITVGSLAFSISLYLLMDYDREAFNRIGVRTLLDALPYFWFIFLAIFIAVGEYYYRRTTFGHRYRLTAITSAYITITILIGSLGYYAGLGSKVENMISRDVGFYQKYLYNKEAVWSQPENGLLSGTIVSVDGINIIIKDFNGKLWKIDTSRAFVRPRVTLSAGEMIKIIGNISGKDSFISQEIRPWQGMGQGRMGQIR